MLAVLTIVAVPVVIVTVAWAIAGEVWQRRDE
jgi:hypothetical protein